MNFSLIVLSSILTLWTAPGIQGHSDGAPKNHKVCKGLRPHHGGTSPQKSTSPYIVTVSKNIVPVDSAVEVILTSLGNATSFRGLVMQAHAENVLRNKPIGMFLIEDAMRSKPLNCFGINDTVTHSSPVEKKTITFKWLPPKGLKGTVYFSASFVQVFPIYWIHVSAKVIIGSAGKVDPKWLVPYPPENPLTSLKYFNYRKKSKLQRSFYESCGSDKKCFGMPGDCVATASCDAVMSVVEKGQIFEFEIFGENSDYVAIRLTDKNDANRNSVTECLLLNNNVNLRHSPIKDKELKHSQTQTSLSDIVLLNSSYVEGTIYCKFSRNQTIHVDGVRYDMNRIKYFMTLAIGNIKEGSTSGTLRFSNIKFKTCDTIMNLSFDEESNLTENETFSLVSWIRKVYYCFTRTI